MKEKLFYVLSYFIEMEASPTLPWQIDIASEKEKIPHISIVFVLLEYISLIVLNNDTYLL